MKENEGIDSKYDREKIEKLLEELFKLKTNGV